MEDMRPNACMTMLLAMLSVATLTFMHCVLEADEDDSDSDGKPEQHNADYHWIVVECIAESDAENAQKQEGKRCRIVDGSSDDTRQNRDAYHRVGKGAHQGEGVLSTGSCGLTRPEK